MDYATRNTAPAGPPVEIELLLTRACNLLCPHCCAAAGTPDPDELSTDQWLHIIHQLADLGVMTVALTGGEPMMRQDFTTIVDAVVSNGMSACIATNGWFFTPHIVSHLSQLGSVSVNISLDGPADYHDHFRGVRGSFDRAINAIGMLSSAGVPTAVNFMVTDHSTDLFMETAAIAAAAGARSISIGQCGTLGRSDSQLGLSWRHWRQFIVKLTDLRKQGQLPLGIRGLWTGGWQLYLALPDRLQDAFDPQIWGKPPEVTPDCGTCPAGVYTAAIGPQGDLYPCDTMSSYPELSCGSVIAHTVSTVWQQSRLLARLRNLDYKSFDPCGQCPFGNICHGGCRGCTYGATRQLSGPDPRCPRVQAAKRRSVPPQLILPSQAAESDLLSETDQTVPDMTRTLELLGSKRKFSLYPKSVISKGDAPGVSFVYMNRTAFYILELLASNKTLSKTAGAIALKFGISAARATADLHDLLTTLSAGNYLEPRPVEQFLTSSMRPADQDRLPPVIARPVATGNYLLFATGPGQIRVMNESGTVLIQEIAAGRTIEQCARTIADKYNIDIDQALTDVNEFWAEAHEFLDGEEETT